MDDTRKRYAFHKSLLFYFPIIKWSIFPKKKQKKNLKLNDGFQSSM